MKPAEDPMTERITAALQRSVRTARAMHKALGLPFVVWQDGRVRYLDPETLEPMPWPSGVHEKDPPYLPPG